MGGSALALLLFAFVVAGGQRGAVDWSDLRAVAFESDDWGLAGFVPDAGAWEGLERQALGTGRFPEVYWQSTLEDSAMVADLCGLLRAHVGRDGRGAVLQPNYVVSSLGYRGRPPQGRWISFDWPQVPPEYRRPGLDEAVKSAIATGCWYPEFHGRYHYDPARRLADAFADSLAAAATLRGIMLFPGSERARELGSWRSTGELEDELDQALGVFRRVFGRSPGSVIAPDYTWNGRIEDIWQSRGLNVIQGKREQINPDWLPGRPGRAQKFLARQLSRLTHPGRTYLERNCRFEPVQFDDPREPVASCLAEIRHAWRSGRPAIVETHRINFVHTDPAVVRAGREAFALLLTQVGELPGDGPLYLTDHEIAQLDRGGASWSVRGGRIVLRNHSRSRKVVAVPVAAFNLAAALAGSDARATAPLLLALAPGGSIDLVPGQEVGIQKIKR
jgi:hypothetical protein